MNQNISLKEIIEIINKTGGYLVFPDEAGNEYVLATRDDFEGGGAFEDEVQLTLPDSSSSLPDNATADDMLEKINRDIALFQLQQAEEEEADQPVLSGAMETAYAPFPEDSEQDSDVEPPRRVRFEPLRGDLPPELQE